MAFAITQTCCADATCVSVCPVNCIHPTPDEPDFGRTDMLYIDPATCIDCGACADACPVDAIFPAGDLTGPLRVYEELNAEYYAGRDVLAEVSAAPNFHRWAPPAFERVLPSDFAPLDVAVVGTGPAGMYAVEDLLLHTNARVTLVDRLPVAGGLIRYGVAPDHPSTKKIGETFARFHDHPRLRLRLGVTAGAELAGRHDAVIFAVGATEARPLGVPGEDLPGSVPAATVVGWYNGHPDVEPDAVDLSAERVVVVGTGNVALDIARILTADPEQLAGTSIAPEALARLRSSKVREVVVLARRGPETAAYTRSELLALAARGDLVVDTHDPRIAAAIDTAEGKAAWLRGVRREQVDWSVPPPDGRRIVLRFHSAPVAFRGDTEVRAVLTSGEVEIPAGRVIRAAGFRGTAVPGLPFDEESGTVPNTAGRVAGLPGVYVAGWIKRGPSGGIGANKACARETIGALLEDAVAGRLPVRRRGVGARLRGRA
ncbi:FAD-dependent oxidoreductase [Amycolatopsis vancoresmycina]|uniref:ferredoxin--NADP(+) reductase n=1 Tax=Amycolatopsis vancoresmycina DSM 44592 TaxID=1292037 RepID=R1I0R2_9PSEU|nr:FAD-dependent oxidoreductase [Amycolatopsis vancoresmycina]EOD64054.1 ferredoxin--NADP+ reductase [Amycolatopsis vancoresmycina DSM 44592]